LAAIYYCGRSTARTVRRDELPSRMPANKIETRLQGALIETLYPLIELGDVALSFTYPSRVFLIETTRKSEIAFELEKALEYVAAEDRAELTHEYSPRKKVSGSYRRILQNLSATRMGRQLSYL
jgi:hypothetical protein